MTTSEIWFEVAKIAIPMITAVGAMWFAHKSAKSSEDSAKTALAMKEESNEIAEEVKTKTERLQFKFFLHTLQDTLIHRKLTLDHIDYLLDLNNKAICSVAFLIYIGKYQGGIGKTAESLCTNIKEGLLQCRTLIESENDEEVLSQLNFVRSMIISRLEAYHEFENHYTSILDMKIEDLPTW